MPDNNPPIPGKYIDPLVDFAFKKIFGSEPNKDLLIAFLNEVFRGRKHIVDLSYNKNEHPGDLRDEGGAIFDLLCTGEDNERFIIEVQRGRQGYFKERALFYTSRLISDQAPKGKRSDWAYNLTGVYLVALLEDFTLGVNNSTGYLHDICLCNRDTGEIFYDKLGYTYIELRNFVKDGTQLETDLDRWLYVLKNMSQMDKIPVYLRKPVFEKLFNIAEYTNLTKEEKNMYDSSLKYKWDNKNVLDYAMKEGMEKGMEIGIERGIERGIEKGMKQGMEQGMKKGEHTKALEVARELKKIGINVEHIAKSTGLSITEIEKL
jgi:predicted transposase/invertase (TIGR01784 family)